MEAKDTVMTTLQIEEIPEWDSWDLGPVIEAQAEISFKAGVKEMVEWFRYNSLTDNVNDYGTLRVSVNNEEWQAYKKKLGVE